MQNLVGNIKELVFWGLLHVRLAQAHLRGSQIIIWLRDDDVIEPTPALSEFLATMHMVPVSLAAIPANVKDSLVNMHSQLTILHHGWKHENHGTHQRSEFPAGSDEKMVVAQLRRGRRVLKRIFPEHYRPIFVPPWNDIGDDVIEYLPQVPFLALSTFGNQSQASSMVSLNAHVDVIDWQRGVGQPTYLILKHLVNEIELRLKRDVNTPIGILTHHLMHDRGLNDRLGKLVMVLDAKRAVRWFNPRESSLFTE